MKSKGKTLVTSKPEPQAATKAITPYINVWDSLDKCIKDLSPGDSRFVTEHVSSIQKDLIVMNERKDSIAASLAAIHTKVGKDTFARMTENVFPRFGMSRSTCYRLIDSAGILREALPEPQVRSVLLGRFEKPLTTTTKTGEVVLTPAFKKALEIVPKPAKLESPEAIDSYTAAVIAETRKLGKPAKKSANQQRKEATERINDAFGVFLEKWGTDHAAKLIEGLRGVLVLAQNTIEGAPVAKAQPEAVKTEKTIGQKTA